MHQRRVGVEEELLLVDAGTGQPRAVSRAVLLALSANSPFWQGRDSGHASYRSDVWGR